ISQTPFAFNPEPPEVQRGRLFLYDASLSAHGDSACASCHRNGHRDGLAWDLGDPKGQLVKVKGLITSTFHPMKGPMTTQSLRGIIGTEPFHWRGDTANLMGFNPAFMSLLGGPRQLTDAELTDFEAFVKGLTYPPNPNENLDRTYPNPSSGPSAAHGLTLFTTANLDAGALTCNACHTASPGFLTGTDGVIFPGAVIREPQDMKVPQLRGMYQKLGMVNAPGDQLSGFGFEHDGTIDTVFDFLRNPLFTFASDNDRRDVEAFVLAFDTGIAPSVGLQVTIDSANKTSPAVMDRVTLMMAQADSANCDLIVKGIYGGVTRGFLYIGNGMFQPDKQSDQAVSWQMLLQAAGTGSELTFTGVPAGEGRRMGIDRNGDGILDGDQ
ncbi:MAG TPA: hypothetical protein VJX67_27225, partial [Blastocatellia bacterium]|nr:hypothetical protein [Blastocatellia bacterium]